MKLDMAVHTCNPNIQEVEAGGLPQVHASQNYIARPCFKEQKTKPSPNKISKNALIGF